MKSYEPPFTITNSIMNEIIEIGELTGKVSATHKLSSNPTLRRANRIRTIHSSLAIEQNGLTLDQVSDVIEGKRILGSPNEIKEVKNAYEAYEIIGDFDPLSIKDLLKAHKILMMDLVRESGTFRSKGVGVYAGDHLIHAGSPPQYVPGLMKDLFQWLKESDIHPLVKSCVFHYEFEFIHPFEDGNGRMGRMWHTLLLSKWRDFFAWLPIETLIHERQEEYYRVLNAANSDGQSTVFEEFMLETIRDSLLEVLKEEKLQKDVGIKDGMNVGINLSETENRIIKILSNNPRYTANEIASELDLTKRQIERGLAKLKEHGIVERRGARRNGYWKITGFINIMIHL